MASATKHLSSNDAWVLHAIFNPDSAPTTAPKSLINPNLPPLPHNTPANLPALQATERAALRPLLHSPSPPQHLVHAALATLDALIAAHPTYASAYNNRAQARALLDAPARDAALLWDDVCAAIRLARPPRPDAQVAPLQADVLAAAHTQRAKLLWQTAQTGASATGTGQAEGMVSAGVGKDARGGTEMRMGGEEAGRGAAAAATATEDLAWGQVCVLDAAALEELANRDFEMAGRYGNEDARRMGVITNPYGRMCGAIVREAMREETARALATVD